MTAAPLQGAAASKKLGLLSFSDTSRVALAVTSGNVQASYRDAPHRREVVSVSRELDSAIAHADALHFLLHDPDTSSGLAIIVLSEPSTNTSGHGFCGAGTEDNVILIEKRNHTITYKDRYLLQSCLQSITLDADNPDDVLSGLSTDARAFTVTFKLLDDPDKKMTTLTVKNGKLMKLPMPANHP